MHQLFYLNLEPGTVLFGKFEIITCLSSGDVGGVYLCRDNDKRQEKIVLKVLTSITNCPLELRQQFLREHALANQVKHPNVISSLNYFDDGVFSGFSMEYLERGTLADLMADGQQLSLKRVVDILLQLARGLHAIHDAGIIHRDLKPENILFNRIGRVKIADFGIAVTRESGFMPSIDEMVGTLNYLSPEYVKSGAWDQRSDIYSLGVIAYELLTGVLPFEGESQFEKNGVVESLVHRVCFYPHPPILLRDDCPALLSAIITKAMRREPENRYQHVGELLSDLEVLVESWPEELPEAVAWSSARRSPGTNVPPESNSF